MADVDYSKYGAVPVSGGVDYSKYGAVPVDGDSKGSDKSISGNSWGQVAKGVTKGAFNAGLNAVIGAGDEALALPTNLYNLATPKSANVALPKNSSGFAYNAGKVGGGLASLIPAGVGLNAVRGAAEALPMVGKAAQYLGGSGALQSAARLGTGMGAHGAVMNPDHPVVGALAEGIPGAVLGAAGSAFDKLKPTNYYRGNLNPEKLRDNVRIAGDTNTPLGDVIESPALKHLYENDLSKQYLSGSEKLMANTADKIVGKGQGILNKYLGNTHPEQVEEKIGNALIKAHETQNTVKNSLYKKAEDLAEGNSASTGIATSKISDGKEIGPSLGTPGKESLKLTFPEFSGNVNKYSDLIKDKDFLKFDPELKSILKNISDYKGEVKLKDANILAGRLNSLAKESKASPLPEDRNMSRIYGELGRSLKGDIKTSINNSGNKELQDAFNKAEENYKNNFSPLLDRDIYKFTNGGKSAEDIMQNFIKTGSTTDKGKQLDKLMSKLDPETQNLVKYSYLSRGIKGAENERYVDPNAIKTLWGDTKLGPKQKKALFPDSAERKELDDYSKLTSMNSEALGRMFNPKTGARTSTNFVNTLHAALGIGGGGVGFALGGLPGAAAGAVIPSAVSKYLTKQITSPEARTAFVEKMIKGDKSGKSGINKSAAATTALIQTLMDAYK